MTRIILPLSLDARSIPDVLAQVQKAGAGEVTLDAGNALFVTTPGLAFLISVFRSFAGRLTVVDATDEFRACFASAGLSGDLDAVSGGASA